MKFQTLSLYLFDVYCRFDQYEAMFKVVVVVFTLKAVPVSTQYFLTSVLVQLTRTPSVVTGLLPRKGTHIKKK